MKKSLLSLLTIITVSFNCYTGNCCAGNGGSKPYKHHPMHLGLSQTYGGYPTFNGLDDDTEEQDPSLNKSASSTDLDEKFNIKTPPKLLKSILKKPKDATAAVIST
ncbi:hypothetical protein EBU24_04375, partial [bacterium]|nr:hypothetical protein [bacterium]